jgi:hypothetical protein
MLLRFINFLFTRHVSLFTRHVSTYMATHEAAFRSAVEKGSIFAWKPSCRIKQERILAVTLDVRNWLSNSWGGDADPLELLRSQTLAVCDRYIDGTAPLLQLFKIVGGRKGVAMMRVLSPSPGVRLIGGFLSDDVFVALSSWRRDELPHKRSQVQTDSAGTTWRELVDKAAQDWSVIFPTVATPHRPVTLTLKRVRT